MAPFLDEPLSFKDKFFLDGQFQPNAILTACHPVGFTIWRVNNTYAGDTGVPTCDKGAQPGTGDDMDTGWELTFHPNQWAYDLRRADMYVDIFVPLEDFEVDPCTDLTVDIEFKNMAVQSDGWTASGLPMNGTGLEPGWDGSEATGNNVVTHKPNFSSQCGSLAGSKVYAAWADGQNDHTDLAGTRASDRRCGASPTTRAWKWRTSRCAMCSTSPRSSSRRLAAASPGSSP